MEEKNKESEQAKKEILKQINMLKGAAAPCPKCKSKDLEATPQGFDLGIVLLSGLISVVFLYIIRNRSLGWAIIMALSVSISVGIIQYKEHENFILKCKSCGHEWDPLEKKNKTTRLRRALIVSFIIILIWVYLGYVASVLGIYF